MCLEQKGIYSEKAVNYIGIREEMMDIKKVVQVVGYILSKYQGKLNYTKLIKMLYLADRESMRQTGYPITGDNYVSMPRGVVLSGMLDLIKDNYSVMDAQNYWNSRFETNGRDLNMISRELPTGQLTENELSILDAIDKRFHRFDYGYLINYIHDSKNCPEWEPTESSIPLPKTRIYKALGYSDVQIQALEEEEKMYMAEDALIDSLK